MKTTLSFLAALLLASYSVLNAATPDLSQITSRADLDAVIAATKDVALQQALTENATSILAAAEQHPHVEAVISTIESAPGTYTKINITPESLKKAAGGNIALFDTLTLVNTNIVNGMSHAYRGANEDPYDATFIEHLGHIASLESVKIVATKIEDSWLPPLPKLKNLKSLSIEGTARGLPANPPSAPPASRGARRSRSVPRSARSNSPTSGKPPTPVSNNWPG